MEDGRTNGLGADQMNVGNGRLFDAAEADRRNRQVADQLAHKRVRLFWRSAIAVSTFALLVSVVGCLFMMRSQGVREEVAEMRQDVGASLTQMQSRDPGEVFARCIPALEERLLHWKERFANTSRFRGMDEEINSVQAMYRLEASVQRWHAELEGVSAMQRHDTWTRLVHPQVEAEAKNWPNVIREKRSWEWGVDFGKEFGYGISHGMTWPYGVWTRLVEVVKMNGNKGAELFDYIRYVIFPYKLSVFTFIRLAGIIGSVLGLGFLFCWLGTKFNYLSALSYLGLLYFVYLLVAALFIVWLEVA